MENKRSILAGQKGFTLIEVIAVLVILGVLAAVAIPKYMDMQTDAQIAATSGAIAAAATNVTLTYSQTLLKGGTTPVMTTPGSWTSGLTTTAIPTSVGDFTAGYTATGCATAAAACSVVITLSAGPTSWFASVAAANKTKTIVMQ